MKKLSSLAAFGVITLFLAACSTMGGASTPNTASTSPAASNTTDDSMSTVSSH